MSDTRRERTELTDDEIDLLYSNHQQSIERFWGEVSWSTRRFPVERWLKWQLADVKPWFSEQQQPIS
jgi:hypothetical protein